MGEGTGDIMDDFPAHASGEGSAHRRLRLIRRWRRFGIVAPGVPPESRETALHSSLETALPEIPAEEHLDRRRERHGKKRAEESSQEK